MQILSKPANKYMKQWLIKMQCNAMLVSKSNEMLLAASIVFLSIELI